MAAQQRKQTGGHMKHMMKPVISSDIMGNRNVEIKPVGAWVQPAFHSMSCDLPDAIVAAVEEELKIRQIQRQKEEKIHQFHEEVKKRVRRLNKLKRQNEMQKNIQAVEMERDIVRQSSKSTVGSMSLNNNCLRRNDHEFTNKPKSAAIIQGGWVKNDEENLAFHNKSNQVHRMTSQARRKLVSHQISTDGDAREELPGGMWAVSATRDKPTHVTRVSAFEEELASKEVDNFNEDDKEEEKENYTAQKVVHFDLPNSKETRRSIRARSAGGDAPRMLAVPNIYTGVEERVERRRQQNQHALYRRHFMDIEREQVKENLRRQEHRKRIQRLKREKEEERKQQEDNSLKLVRPRDPVTGETTEEVLMREQLEQLHIQVTLEKFKEEKRKAREMTRYVEALRHSLQEKVEKRGIQVPPLCCCGESVWDTNPDTCANNCYFYRNPKAYAKALQCLLASCEVV